MAKRGVLQLRQDAALIAGLQLEDGELPPAVRGDVDVIARIYGVSCRELKVAVRLSYNLKLRHGFFFRHEKHFFDSAVDALFKFSAAN